MGHNKVDKWRTGLDSIQSVNHHDSESPLNTMAFSSPTNSTLENLVDPNDSASQVSPIISESSLDNVTGAADATRVYDITDPKLLNLYIGDETMDF